jgi:hypothetical protein
MKILIILLFPVFAFSQTNKDIVLMADSLSRPYFVDAAENVKEILHGSTLIGKYGITKQQFINSYNSSALPKYIGVETTVSGIVNSLKKNGTRYAMIRFLEAKSRFLAKLKYEFIESHPEGK